MLSIVNIDFQPASLDLILPVGISFYTFQTLSYTIDVYNRKLEPTKDFIAFSAFVCFFPQLVAGPIERATHLLPQFYKKRTFEYDKAVDGMRQILWGLFKKVVIADNCAEFANQIFNNSADLNGSTLVLGAIFFAFQIYGDFSGYSDIAIGTSRLFSFDIKQNFATPYFSKNIIEFWRRWHISLSKWLTDYVFTPLALELRHFEKTGIIISLLITFLLSGLWHGAGWNFILYGLIHAIYFLITLSILGHKKSFNSNSEDKIIPSLKDSLSMILTFVLVSFSYIFFRAENLSHAFSYIGGIFSKSFFEIPLVRPRFVFLVILFMIIEWFGRDGKFAIEKIFLSFNKTWRFIFYTIIIVLMLLFFTEEKQPFIYFQF